MLPQFALAQWARPVSPPPKKSFGVRRYCAEGASAFLVPFFPGKAEEKSEALLLREKRKKGGPKGLVKRRGGEITLRKGGGGDGTTTWEKGFERGTLHLARMGGGEKAYLLSNPL